jgi:hypothetical protein
METEPQALEPVPEEVPEVPEVPEEVVEVKQEVPKRRGRPPGAKNKPKPKVEAAEVEKVAEAPDYEPRQEDVALATRYFARHLGQMSQMSLDAKRARWRELFM